MPNDDTDKTATDAAAAKVTADAATEKVTVDTAAAKVTADAAAAKAESDQKYDGAYVKTLRDEAAKSRIALRDFQTKTETERKAIAKALGIDDGSADPVKLQEALALKDAEVRQLRIEGKVRSLAGKNSADAEALLDSRSFVKALSEIDPSAADSDTAIGAAIAAALAANAKLKIVQAATKGGLEISGSGGGGPTLFSRAQLRDHAFYTANEKAITEAMRDGRIRD